MKRNAHEPAPTDTSHPGFVIHSSFRKGSAFTIIELLIVITVIAVLAALVLSTAGYVQNKAARSRAGAEIAAISAACENYKADNGIYPTNTDTYGLDARTAGNPTAYQKASLYLYEALYGVTDGNRSTAPTAKTYLAFKPNMLYPADQTQPILFIRDAFGNSYGYSTAANPAAAPPNTTPPTGVGFNPTFDLWSTGGVVSNGTPDQTKWIKNW